MSSQADNASWGGLDVSYQTIGKICTSQELVTVLDPLKLT